MALIKTSAVISDISGKLNGSVFQRSLGGIILRTKSTSINRKTTAQLFQRAGVKAMQQKWFSLSSSDVNAWNAYAVYRNKSQRRNITLKQSGQNLFVAENSVRYNLQSWIANLSPITISTPNFNPQPAPPLLDSIQSSGGVLYFVTPYSITDTDEYWYIKLSRPLTYTQASQYNPLKVIPYGQVSGSVQEINVGYLQMFGILPQNGDYLNYEFCLNSTTSNELGYTTRGRIVVT